MHFSYFGAQSNSKKNVPSTLRVISHHTNPIWTLQCCSLALPPTSTLCGGVLPRSSTNTFRRWMEDQMKKEPLSTTAITLRFNIRALATLLPRIKLDDDDNRNQSTDASRSDVPSTPQLMMLSSLDCTFTSLRHAGNDPATRMLVPNPRAAAKKLMDDVRLHSARVKRSQCARRHLSMIRESIEIVGGDDGVVLNAVMFPLFSSGYEPPCESVVLRDNYRLLVAPSGIPLLGSEDKTTRLQHLRQLYMWCTQIDGQELVNSFVSPQRVSPSLVNYLSSHLPYHSSKKQSLVPIPHACGYTRRQTGPLEDEEEYVLPPNRASAPMPTDVVDYSIIIATGSPVSSDSFTGGALLNFQDPAHSSAHRTHNLVHSDFIPISKTGEVAATRTTQVPHYRRLLQPWTLQHLRRRGPRPLVPPQHTIFEIAHHLTFDVPLLPAQALCPARSSEAEKMQRYLSQTMTTSKRRYPFRREMQPIIQCATPPTASALVGDLMMDDIAAQSDIGDAMFIRSWGHSMLNHESKVRSCQARATCLLVRTQEWDTICTPNLPTSHLAVLNAELSAAREQRSSRSEEEEDILLLQQAVREEVNQLKHRRGALSGASERSSLAFQFEVLASHEVRHQLNNLSVDSLHQLAPQLIALWKRTSSPVGSESRTYRRSLVLAPWPDVASSNLALSWMTRLGHALVRTGHHLGCGGDGPAVFILTTALEAAALESPSRGMYFLRVEDLIVHSQAPPPAILNDTFHSLLSTWNENCILLVSPGTVNLVHVRIPHGAEWLYHVLSSMVPSRQTIILSTAPSWSLVERVAQPLDVDASTQIHMIVPSSVDDDEARKDEIISSSLPMRIVESNSMITSCHEVLHLNALFGGVCDQQRLPLERDNPHRHLMTSLSSLLDHFWITTVRVSILRFMEWMMSLHSEHQTEFPGSSGRVAPMSPMSHLEAPSQSIPNRDYIQLMESHAEAMAQRVAELCRREASSSISLVDHHDHRMASRQTVFLHQTRRQPPPPPQGEQLITFINQVQGQLRCIDIIMELRDHTARDGAGFALGAARGLAERALESPLVAAAVESPLMSQVALFLRATSQCCIAMQRLEWLSTVVHQLSDKEGSPSVVFLWFSESSRAAAMSYALSREIQRTTRSQEEILPCYLTAAVCPQGSHTTASGCSLNVFHGGLRIESLRDAGVATTYTTTPLVLLCDEDLLLGGALHEHWFRHVVQFCCLHSQYSSRTANPCRGENTSNISISMDASYASLITSAGFSDRTTSTMRMWPGQSLIPISLLT